RPEIDLAQARTDRANAMVALITAENNYEVSKAQLNLAIGLERDTNYDVQDESTPPVAGEEDAIDPLLAEALKARPDYLSLEKQVQAQEIAIWAARTAYGPNLAASTGFTDAGQELNNLGWNWSFNLTLNWQLFQGGLTWYNVKEQKANLAALEAQRD